MFNQEAKRKPIVLTDELIDIWTERTGKPRELLVEMLDLHHEYIQHLVKNEPDALIIKLPYLGRLRFNYLLGLSYTKWTASHLPIAAKIVKMKELLDLEGNKLKNFNLPLFIKQNHVILGAKARTPIPLFYTYWKALEEKHNEWYNKKFKSGNKK